MPVSQKKIIWCSSGLDSVNAFFFLVSSLTWFDEKDVWDKLEVSLSQGMCFTDGHAVLFWIQLVFARLKTAVVSEKNSSGGLRECLRCIFYTALNSNPLSVNSLFTQGCVFLQEVALSKCTKLWSHQFHKFGLELDQVLPRIRRRNSCRSALHDKYMHRNLPGCWLVGFVARFCR